VLLLPPLPQRPPVESKLLRLLLSRPLRLLPDWLLRFRPPLVRLRLRVRRIPNNLPPLPPRTLRESPLPPPPQLVRAPRSEISCVLKHLKITKKKLRLLKIPFEILLLYVCVMMN